MGRVADIADVLLQLGLSVSCTDEERVLANVSLTRAEGSVRRHLKYDPVSASRTEYYPQQSVGTLNAEGVWEADENNAFMRQLSEAATSILLVQHVPIRSVPAIDLRIDYGARSGTVAGSFAVAALKIEGTDYWPNYDSLDSAGNKVCRDGIIRSFGRWPTEAGSVCIIYTAGYTAAELRGQDMTIDASPIFEAVVDEAVRRFKKALQNKKTVVGFLAGPIVSENIGEYSYSIDSSAAARLFGSVWDVLPETVQKLHDFVQLGVLLGG